jgi:type II restriction enzyme
MNLQLETELGINYTSNSQKIRVITESWVGNNLFCPSCGAFNIKAFSNNKKVADFYCSNCSEQYELKAKNGLPKTSIPDGAFETMIERLNSNTNPNLFFLDYDEHFEVNNFLAIPKYFFTTDIIQKRKPLSEKARRAGWVGCNIIYSKIPKIGIIPIVQNKIARHEEEIKSLWHKTSFLQGSTNLEARGWTLDILKVIELIGNNSFSLNNMYAFENELQKKHPENNHIKDKIRQQLQILRDKGYIEFIGGGNYKIN